MKIIITNTFKKSAKKLMKNQIKIVEDTIDKLAINPKMGELKKGDLAGIMVYKFYINKQLMLLVYQYHKKELILVSLSTHENFYRDLKKRLDN